AAARLGQRVGETDVVRTGESPDLLGDVLAERLPEVFRCRLPGLERYERGDRLALQIVGPPHDGRLRDRGMAHERALHLHRAQTVARDVHHVVDPTHDPEVTVRIATGTVPREVDARHLAPVLLTVALGIAVDSAQHPGPRTRDDEVATLVRAERLSV